MKKPILVEHHLGLGDHLVCNGLYRKLSEKHSLVLFVVSGHNYASVKTMLRGVRNVIILPPANLNPVRLQSALRRLFEILGLETLSLGFFGQGFLTKSELTKFDQNFYLQAGFTFDNRWTKFSFPRNLNREEKVFARYGVKPQSYIFLHEDTERGFIIDRTRITSDLPVVSPQNVDSIGFFDYALLIEQAAELHCIESSFAALIEGMDLHQPKFAHRYARPEAITNPRYEFTYRSDWEILV